MSLRALSDAQTVCMTPADTARASLALLVYECDQFHREGKKLSPLALQALADGAAEVLRLEGRL